MVVETGSWVYYRKIGRSKVLQGATGTKRILETAGGDYMSYLKIHEAEVMLGKHVFHHVVFVGNITEDVFLELDLMEQKSFCWKNKMAKTGQDKIVMTTPEQYSRIKKVTL